MAGLNNKILTELFYLRRKIILKTKDILDLKIKCQMIGNIFSQIIWVSERDYWYYDM